VSNFQCRSSWSWALKFYSSLRDSASCLFLQGKHTRCAVDLGLNYLLLISPRCVECKLIIYVIFIDSIYLNVCSLAKKESAAVEGSKNSKTTLQPTSASKVETQLITSVDNSTGDEHTSLPSVTSAEIISSLVPEQSIVESLQKDLNKPSVIKNVSSSTNLIYTEVSLFIHNLIVCN